MKRKNILKFVFSILICQLAGVIGSFFTTSAIDGWYKTLEKPSFSPPDWLFGPVWIFLYLLMGISLYLILNTKKNKSALWLFFIQLALNSIWSVIFFGLKSPFYALIELGVLIVAIVLTIWQFWKINSKAAMLLLPYIAWCTFALILNYSIWQLN